MSPTFLLLTYVPDTTFIVCLVEVDQSVFNNIKKQKEIRILTMYKSNAVLCTKHDIKSCIFYSQERGRGVN